MDQPLVTVIITTYNYAHTVGTAIDSALRQDYPNIEVLVVDNASTDRTPELVEKYTSDPRFRYVRNAENIGMVPNHNKGLREARGAYLLFLSADDFLMPHSISYSYRYLMDHPGIDVLYTTTYFVNESGTYTGVRQMSGQPHAAYNVERNEFAWMLAEGCYMCFPTMLMRRDLYERFGELDEAIKAADYEIVVRWAANGVRFAYEPEPTAAVRLHSAQQSSPQNYVVDGGDILEFVYLVQKFAPVFGAGLKGFETTVSRHMWTRYRMAQDSGVKDEDGAIRAKLLEVDQLIAGVRTRNLETVEPVRPTVIVLPGGRVGDLERTLRSLTTQTFGGWTALVLEYATHPFGAIGADLDPAGRIGVLRLTGALQDALLVNTALRVAPGNAFIVMRPGSVLPPTHLAHLEAALSQTKAVVARTTATVNGKNIYMPPTDRRLAHIAPFGPIEALAFTRQAVDIAGLFDTRMPVFPEWEFYLRASSNGPSVAFDSAPAIAAIEPNAAFAQIKNLPSLARIIYPAYPTTDASINAERDAYMRNLEGLIAQGPAAIATPESFERLLIAAYGTELLAGAR